MRLRGWREGVLAGTWDIINPIPSHRHIGQWLETKRPGEHLSKEQEEFRELLLPYGWRFDIGRSVEELLEAWCDHLQIELRING